MNSQNFSLNKVILVGIALEGGDIEETKAHIEELRELARTLEMEVKEVVIQRRKRFSARTKIGKGKVEEVAEMVKEYEVGCVIFDDELSAGQVRNLEKVLGCKVWDRTLLILEIFAMRACTVQAKTQVALARYQYLLPRLTRMWSHLSRQGGGRGAGMQGTGEKELETDRRVVQRKIHLLKEKLIAIGRQTSVRRAKRGDYVNVALVGYTNVGKSTLMRRIAKVEVGVEDKLFATLSTTVRKVVFEKVPFLLSDTVGFIRKLPHRLVECFKSTLVEVCEADLLLHVVDCAHTEFATHIEVVKETLKEIGAEKAEVILLFNKVDLLLKRSTFTSLKEIEVYYSALYGGEVIAVSATEGIGLDRLRSVLSEKVAIRHQQLYPQNKALLSSPVVQWKE